MTKTTVFEKSAPVNPPTLKIGVLGKLRAVKLALGGEVGGVFGCVFEGVFEGLFWGLWRV